METQIVDSEEDLNAAVAEAETRGLRVAAVSNAGLPRGTVRITFLPASAFTDYKSKAKS